MFRVSTAALMGLTKGNALYNIPFTGNLTHDLELNSNTASGIARLNFRLAVNEGERGTDNEKTHFLPFTAFGTTAENAAKSFKKGDRMIVLARVNTYPKNVYLPNAQDELEEKELNLVGFTASDISAPVRFATLDIHKVAKKEGSEGSAPAKKAPAPRAAAASKPKVSVPAGADDDF
jgi:single-strand DNA-binding protein